MRGPVAQRLEQGTHNPLVPGSNPGGPSPESFRGCRAVALGRRRTFLTLQRQRSQLRLDKPKNSFDFRLSICDC